MQWSAAFHLFDVRLARATAAGSPLLLVTVNGRVADGVTDGAAEAEAAEAAGAEVAEAAAGEGARGALRRAGPLGAAAAHAPAAAAASAAPAACAAPPAAASAALQARQISLLCHILRVSALLLEHCSSSRHLYPSVPRLHALLGSACHPLVEGTLLLLVALSKRHAASSSCSATHRTPPGQDRCAGRRRRPSLRCLRWLVLLLPAIPSVSPAPRMCAAPPRAPAVCSVG